MRVFAGPNGSGKSTMYEYVRNYRLPDGRKIDVGIYVNPDRIAAVIRDRGRLDLGDFGLTARARLRYLKYLKTTTLIPSKLSLKDAKRWVAWSGKAVRVATDADVDRVAQLLTQFICEELIRSKRKFSFETVFSDASKLRMMELAKKGGFKVYLYFIATNDPEINKDWVQTRVELGGHDVPTDIIEKRYYRSLDLLRPAVALSYHAFMFDNSGTKASMFAEYKRLTAIGTWTHIEPVVPLWFTSHYILPGNIEALGLDVPDYNAAEFLKLANDPAKKKFGGS